MQPLRESEYLCGRQKLSFRDALYCERMYRKPHPTMFSVLGSKTLCSCARIPCSAEIIPCFVEQGIPLKAFEYAGVSASKISLSGWVQRKSLFFSLLAGNLAAETGSTATTSATTHSSLSPKSPALSRTPRTSGLLRAKNRGVQSLLRREAVRRVLFGRHVSAAGEAVPGSVLANAETA